VHRGGSQHFDQLDRVGDGDGGQQPGGRVVARHPQRGQQPPIRALRHRSQIGREQIAGRRPGDPVGRGHHLAQHTDQLLRHLVG